jgi:hypothetical protein
VEWDMRWRILPQTGHTAEILGVHRGKRKREKKKGKKRPKSFVEVVIIKRGKRGIKEKKGDY